MSITELSARLARFNAQVVDVKTAGAFAKAAAAEKALDEAAGCMAGLVEIIKRQQNDINLLKGDNRGQ